MRILLILGLLVAVAAVGCSAPAADAPADATARPGGDSGNATATVVAANLPPCQWADVVRVVDGDTIVVRLAGKEERLRYIGVDTPETVAPGTPVQPFGPEATKLNRSLVEGKKLCLEKDVSERDRFGRLLRYAWLADGRMVNEELLLAGLATVSTYPPDVKYVESRYVPAQRAARDAGRGLWSVP